MRVCALIAFQMIFYLHSSQTNSCIVRKENMMHFSKKDNSGGISQRVHPCFLSKEHLSNEYYFCVSQITPLKGTSLDGIFSYLSKISSVKAKYLMSLMRTHGVSQMRCSVIAHLNDTHECHQSSRIVEHCVLLS